MSAPLSIPDVTFVVAAYNSADTIMRAIESALSQEGVTVEVIVVDDCSTDATPALVAAIRDLRVRLIALDRNRGPGGARNAGIGAARGKWIAVLDSDDTVRPDRLRRMIERADSAGAQIVVDNIDVVSLGGGSLRMFPEAQLARMPQLTLPAFIGSNILFRSEHNFGYMKPVFERRFLENHGLRFDETLRIGEDYILLASALACGGRCAVEPSAGYIYHIREGSISRVLRLEHIDAMIAADEAFLQRYVLDAQAQEMQRKRMRGFRQARSFLVLVDQLKKRSLAGAFKTALADPLALRHLGMPIAARLRRLAARLLHPPSHAPMTAVERSPLGDDPHTSKG
ncbi:glycosyltransferase family 2 protein [Sinorhizobium medicae]|uniref:glycosyltransferase family 2 protein n=1 Tax=Sinorhizobium medicae TaxID=110321 RepID=UPI000FE01699|nr:glycosyltransferase family 2 protein [Sinorhizobium medicae]MBO1961030.1 glycosyltransferase family 2 protein [Sinorhizobium medicae]MDX2328385.1 glycosyltransferase [Sinorhizobium medicae]RVI99076.1 glycosyltransferase family 2 protein [Sinorhizobium medicae]WQP42568.1 glycosyltransferase family 2 protein [Sinorhizobium medicae]